MKRQQKPCCAVCEYSIEKDHKQPGLFTAILNTLWCKVRKENVEVFGICDEFKQEYWCE